MKPNRICCLSFVSCLLFAAQAWADDIPAPVESIPAKPLVTLAYAFIWLMVVGFVALLAWRLKKVQTEINTLKNKITPPSL